MIDGYKRSGGWTVSHFGEEKDKTIMDKVESKLQRFKASFAFVSVIGIFFIGGLLVGEVQGSKEVKERFFNEHLSRTDSLIKIQRQFQELYRVQRAADMHIYKQYFQQLQQTDSVLLHLVSRKQSNLLK